MPCNALRSRHFGGRGDRRAGLQNPSAFALDGRPIDVPFFFRILNASRFSRLLRRDSTLESQVRNRFAPRIFGISSAVVTWTPVRVGTPFGVSQLLNGAGDFLEIPDLQEVADELWRKYSHEYQFRSCAIPATVPPLSLRTGLNSATRRSPQR